MKLYSFDLNCSRLRAVYGPAEEAPTVFPLEPLREDLPLVLCLQGRTPEVGTPGLVLCRERPDLTYRDFLPYLGHVFGAPQPWRPRTSLDPQQALGVLFQKLRRLCTTRGEACCALPPYLDETQVHLVYQAAEQAGFRLDASAASPLAAALAARAERPWSGTALLIDLDDHALWVSVLQESEREARLLETYLYPELGLARWKMRLLNALADCCILQSRRDPRAFSTAEQSLYLQLDAIMASCVQNHSANVVFQAGQWHQHMVLPPDDTESFCEGLTRPLLADVQALFNTRWPDKTPTAILLSAQAANLPGLAVHLEDFLDSWFQLHPPEPDESPPPDLEDFGANLLSDEEENGPRPQLILLPADAAAWGTHLLGGYVQSAIVAPGHLDAALPWPTPQPSLDVGPPRLQFQGRDYLLRDRNFTLGRRHDCDLVFDRSRFPAISPWHCEIVYDPRRYFLKDLSREGTWLNDRPVTQLVMLRSGDRIRLGPEGPVVLFLGQPNANGMTA
jgi:hypothetical protein